MRPFLPLCLHILKLPQHQPPSTQEVKTEICLPINTSARLWSVKVEGKKQLATL